MRLRRADLPEENTQAILNRMKSERERVASQLRAEGAEAAARSAPMPSATAPCCWPMRARPPTKLRGEGEQQATKIYADAFQKDPQFFATYRTLQAYREAFAQGQSRLVLTPDAAFLRLLREPPPKQ